MFKQNLEIKKQPFKFTYTMPTLDWYTEINVELKWKEHNSYCLEWRYGGGCWIVANDYDEKNNKWTTDTVGELRSNREIYDFIKWCEALNNCSVLVEMRVIDGCINLYEKIKEVMKIGEKMEGEKNE